MNASPALSGEERKALLALEICAATDSCSTASLYTLQFAVDDVIDRAALTELCRQELVAARPTGGGARPRYLGYRLTDAGYVVARDLACGREAA